MGRKSVKTDKNIYQISREEAGMTRAQSSEALGSISESRIEKCENRKDTCPHPDEVLQMAKVYKKPALCNYYCSHECAIGREYIPEVKLSGLEQIVLKMLSSMNSLERAKDRLIDITADGEIVDDELVDFARIENGVEEISMAADALSLWVQNTIASGKIDSDKLEEARARVNKS